MWYDYIILITSNPAFSENIEAMLDKIIADSGRGPTVIKATETTPAKEGAMVGTKLDNGRNMLHFRLPFRLDSTALLIYLLEPMTDPKPVINMESIRSRDKIIEVDNGDPEVPNEFEYETLLIANKAKFLPYLNDVSDGAGGTQPPNASMDLFLSCYAGVEPIELM